MRNETRSMNADLAEGASDGKYKKVEMDRGGNVGIETWEARRDLSPSKFDIAEAREKVLGDASIHTTPDFVAVPAAAGGALF